MVELTLMELEMTELKLELLNNKMEDEILDELVLLPEEVWVELVLEDDTDEDEIFVEEANSSEEKSINAEEEFSSDDDSLDDDKFFSEEDVSEEPLELPFFELLEILLTEPIFELFSSFTCN